VIGGADMPREKECFRDNLVRLDEVFPDKEMLKINDVVSFTGLNYRTVKKIFPFGKCNVISKVVMARALS
jgi:hypothetical protein